MGKCPTWAWVVMSLLAFTTIILLIADTPSDCPVSGNVSIEEYNSLMDNYNACIVDYNNASNNFIKERENYNTLMNECNQMYSKWQETEVYLLNCYENSLPKCNYLTPTWGK